jgi:hypothetical protein
MSMIDDTNLCFQPIYQSSPLQIGHSEVMESVSLLNVRDHSLPSHPDLTSPSILDSIRQYFVDLKLQELKYRHQEPRIEGLRRRPAILTFVISFNNHSIAE